MAEVWLPPHTDSSQKGQLNAIHQVEPETSTDELWGMSRFPRVPIKGAVIDSTSVHFSSNLANIYSQSASCLFCVCDEKKKKSLEKQKSPNCTALFHPVSNRRLIFQPITGQEEGKRSVVVSVIALAIRAHEFKGGASEGALSICFINSMWPLVLIYFIYIIYIYRKIQNNTQTAIKCFSSPDWCSLSTAVMSG